MFFVVADLFLLKINQINVYVTKCRMFTEKCKKSKKIIKINQILLFQSFNNFVVIFIMSSCAGS